jgi:hypothetical protein
VLDYEDNSMQGYVLYKKKNDKYTLNVNVINLDRIDECVGNEFEPWAGNS